MSNASETVPRRPSRRHPAVIEATVREILPEVKAWFAAGSNGTDGDDAELVKDLARCFDDDAYHFARDLDMYCGWSPDAELIEVLGGALIYGAHEAAVKRWVSENGITVPYRIGETVRLRGELAKIVKIKHETAEIIAQPLVSDGRNYGDTGGWVHPFEEASRDHAQATAESK